MAPRSNRSALEKALERIELCTYAVQEAHLEIEKPFDPERRADLLLATERLAYETLDLLRTAKAYAWGPESEDEE